MSSDAQRRADEYNAAAREQRGWKAFNAGVEAANAGKGEQADRFFAKAVKAGIDVRGELSKLVEQGELDRELERGSRFDQANPRRFSTVPTESSQNVSNPGLPPREPEVRKNSVSIGMDSGSSSGGGSASPTTDQAGMIVPACPASGKFVLMADGGELTWVATEDC